MLRPLALLGLSILFLGSACAATAPTDPAAAALAARKPTAVESVDLKRYTGSWYEVARYPNSYQKGTVGTVATYSLKSNGKIKLENFARKKSLDGRSTSGDGSGRIVKNSDGAKWVVQFIWPFTADYWIIECDPEYRWAIVGQPSKKNLWILARTPELDPATWKDVTGRLAKHGYDQAKLERTPQPKDGPTFKPGGGTVPVAEVDTAAAEGSASKDGAVTPAD